MNVIKKTHIGAYALIQRKPFCNEILLVHKTRGPYKDLWDLPGGRLEPEETPLQAVIRELHEEVGFTPTSAVFLKELTLKFLYSDEGFPIHFIHRAYLFQIESSQENLDMHIHEEDVKGANWVCKQKGQYKLSPLAEMAFAFLDDSFSV